MLEPCVMLADDASRARDVSTEHGMVRVAAEKVQPVVDSRRQVEFSQHARGVSDGVRRFGNVQRDKTTSGLNCITWLTV